jgi:hypothetical protein
MNGLNQMIAQGVRPVQIESPVNQMAQFEQIRSAQQTNALRQAANATTSTTTDAREPSARSASSPWRC